jgi:hypothetical protein
MHQVWSSLTCRLECIQMRSQDVALAWNRIQPFQTFIFGVSCGRKCFLGPCLHFNSGTSIIGGQTVVFV